MFMDCMKKQTHQCIQDKLNIVYKTWQNVHLANCKNTRVSILKYSFKIFFGGFPCCSTREDLSIDVSITIVGLIMTKLRWFQLFVKSQNSNFELFWKKKNPIFVFPWRSTREDLSIDVSITTEGLILTKLEWFYFSKSSQIKIKFRPILKRKLHFRVSVL